MRLIILFSFISVLSACQGQANKPTKASAVVVDTTKKYNQLSDQEERVLVHKATDRAFTGDYYDKKDKGVYLCRQCNNPLYTSDTKFESHCGWPSFDDEIDGSVTRVKDADGQRIEIICSNCKGHLGHVFEGEQFTAKNTRHCVNTSSLKFYSKEEMKSLPAVIK